MHRCFVPSFVRLSSLALIRSRPSRLFLSLSALIQSPALFGKPPKEQQRSGELPRQSVRLAGSRHCGTPKNDKTKTRCGWTNTHRYTQRRRTHTHTHIHTHKERDTPRDTTGQTQHHTGTTKADTGLLLVVDRGRPNSINNESHPLQQGTNAGRRSKHTGG